MRRRVFPILWREISPKKEHPLPSATGGGTPSKPCRPQQLLVEAETTSPSKLKPLRRRLPTPKTSFMAGDTLFILVSALVALSLIGSFWVGLFELGSVSPSLADKMQLYRKHKQGDGKKLTMVKGPCAINLYGLPRRFAKMVLPGLRKNVIEINACYECDYFVHYFDRREESDYRGVDRGRSGIIDPEEIKLLEHAVIDIHTRLNHSIPNVTFVKETEDAFYSRFNTFLQKIFNERAADGRLLYIPLSDGEPFPNTTTINIVKMWHSQEMVWKTMESNQQHYARVAMLRSDVLFVSPVDIYTNPDGTLDLNNKHSVIPAFGNFPVSDRMIYGPVDAVRIWATGRFRHLDRHVHTTFGDGIHSEKYLSKAIFPLIEDAGVPILKASHHLCFLRVRADLSLRFQDCGRDCINQHNMNLVQSILQRNCILNQDDPNVAILECGDTIQNTIPKHDFVADTNEWKDCTPKPI